MYAATLESVQEAAKRIEPYAHKTPVLTCSTLDSLSGHELFFKCEIFQKGGAFKFRGACNAIFSLSPSEASNGVVTHSSGNHAAAVALAARLRGIPAHIVVPRSTPQCKQDAVTGYGGRLYMCEDTIDARHEMCGKVQAETGAALVPPYNHGDVISGQGTIGLELVQQVQGLDAVVVPVSGGGMLSGITVAVKALSPSTRIIAAEPLGHNDAADVAASKAAGQIVDCPKPATIADGLQARMGDLTWPIIRDLVDDVVTVTEREIVDAMRLVMERMKLVVEPSGAVGLAAVLSPSFSSSAAGDAKRVGIILCGGNVDLAGTGFWDHWGAKT